MVASEILFLIMLILHAVFAQKLGLSAEENKCGFFISGRIYNGEETGRQEHPW